MGWTKYEEEKNLPSPPLPPLSIVYPKQIIALVNKIRANPKILIPYVRKFNKGNMDEAIQYLSSQRPAGKLQLRDCLSHVAYTQARFMVKSQKKTAFGENAQTRHVYQRISQEGTYVSVAEIVDKDTFDLYENDGTYMPFAKMVLGLDSYDMADRINLFSD